MSDLRELYQEMILDHNRNPRNFGTIENADRTAEGFNPLCGDHYTFYMNLDDENVREIAFQGSGCAISKASASVMSTTIKGKSRNEAQALFETFRSMVTGEKKPDIDAMGKLAAFSGVSEFPARVKCAILPWHTMSSALKGDQQVVSTE
jgi:nitrogen fixation protein NifU and related proteins